MPAEMKSAEGCNCCEGDGVFDWYGAFYPSPLVSNLFYRTPSTMDDDVFADYTSIDAGWSVNIDHVGSLQVTMAVCDTTQELCWGWRSGDLEHPDSEIGSELLTDPDNPESWTMGGDARYVTATRALEANADVVTSSTVQASTHVDTIAVGEYYLIGVTAAQREQTKVVVVVDDFFGFGLPLSILFDLESEVDSIPVDGAGIRQWRTVQQSGWGDPTTLRVRIVDDSGTTLTASEGDGVFLYGATMRPVTEAVPLYDVVFVDAEAQVMLDVFYPRVGVPLNPDSPGVKLEQYTTAYNALGTHTRKLDRSQAEMAYSATGWPSWPRDVDTDAAQYIDVCLWQKNKFVGGAVDGVRWTALYFAALDTSLVATGLAIQADDAVWRTDGSTQWGVAFPGAFEYTDIYIFGSGGADGPRFPRVVGAPPHGGGSVFSVLLPSHNFKEVSADQPENIDVDGTSVRALTYQAKLLYGEVARSDLEHYWLQSVSDGPPERFYYEGPVLYGDGVIMFDTGSVEKDRLVVWGRQQYPDGAGEFYWSAWPYGAPHVWIAPLFGDAYRGDGGANVPAALFVHGEADVTFEDTELAWAEFKQQVEIPTLTRTLRLYVDDSEVFSKVIWRDSQVRQLPGDLFEVAALGPYALHANDDDAAFVFFEQVWDEGYEPTEETPGTYAAWQAHGTGWLMHVLDATGGELWSASSLRPALIPALDNLLPECVSSSDRFFFVRDFVMCDVRMAGDVAKAWMFRHDGDVAWPTRAVVDNDEDFSADDHAGSDGLVMRDMIKNSDRVSMAPALDIWPDRADIGFTGDLAEPLSTDTDGSYIDEFLSATAVTTSAAQRYSPLITAHAVNKYRVTLEAKAGEVTWLLVRVQDYTAPTDHAQAWIDLSTQSYSDLDDATTQPPVALADDWWRYTIDFAPPPADVTTQLLVRLVDATSATSLTDAAHDVGDGAFLRNVKLQAACP